MKLKRHINFINESDTSSDYAYWLRYKVPDHIGEGDEWVFEGDYVIGKEDEMVDNGEFNQRIPDKVTGTFDCSRIGLTTLKGCPKIIGKNFFCTQNEITNLIGGPKEVGNEYNVNSNKKLTSLEGAPEELKGDYHKTKLISRGDFSAAECALITLKGGPKKISGSIAVDTNKLTSLEGAPIIGESMISSDNPVDFEKIEATFVEENKEDLYNTKHGYWQGLFNWMLSKNMNLSEIKTWPQDFLNSLDGKYIKMLSSYKGIKKYDL